MPKIPTIEMLFLKYAYGTIDDVANLIGGTVAANIRNPKYINYKDTCAIRVSRALNYAGDPIPPLGGFAHPTMKGEKLRSDKGGDEKRYIYSTTDMREYLNKRYGYPKKFPGNATADDVKGLRGIIAFGYVHIDLWDRGTVANSSFFGNAKVANDSVLIWETDSILDSRL